MFIIITFYFLGLKFSSSQNYAKPCVEKSLQDCIDSDNCHVLDYNCLEKPFKKCDKVDECYETCVCPPKTCYFGATICKMLFSGDHQGSIESSHINNTNNSLTNRINEEVMTEIDNSKTGSLEKSHVFYSFKPRRKKSMKEQGDVSERCGKVNGKTKCEGEKRKSHKNKYSLNSSDWQSQKTLYPVPCMEHKIKECQATNKCMMLEFTCDGPKISGCNKLGLCFETCKCPQCTCYYKKKTSCVRLQNAVSISQCPYQFQGTSCTSCNSCNKQSDNDQDQGYLNVKISNINEKNFEDGNDGDDDQLKKQKGETGSWKNGGAKGVNMGKISDGYSGKQKVGKEDKPRKKNFKQKGLQSNKKWNYKGTKKNQKGGKQKENNTFYGKKQNGTSVGTGKEKGKANGGKTKGEIDGYMDDYAKNCDPKVLKGEKEKGDLKGTKDSCKKLEYFIKISIDKENEDDNDKSENNNEKSFKDGNDGDDNQLKEQKGETDRWKNDGAKGGNMNEISDGYSGKQEGGKKDKLEENNFKQKGLQSNQRWKDRDTNKNQKGGKQKGNGTFDLKKQKGTGVGTGKEKGYYQGGKMKGKNDGHVFDYDKDCDTKLLKAKKQKGGKPLRDPCARPVYPNYLGQGRVKGKESKKTKNSKQS